MPIEISEKTIKRDFIEKVIKLSGQDINMCFQCGTAVAHAPCPTRWMLFRARSCE